MIFHQPTEGWPGWVGLYEARHLPEQAQADLWEESSCNAEDFRLSLMDGVFLRSLDKPVEPTVALLDTIGHCVKVLLMDWVLWAVDIWNLLNQHE